MVVADDDTKS